MATNHPLSDYTNDAPDVPECEPGDLVREVDADDDEAMVVVSLPGAQADEYEIDPLAGTTVFGYSGTPDSVEADEAVLEVAYVSTLHHYADSLPDGCTPTTAHQHFEAIEDSPVTVYAYPESQIESAE